jgi:hypothetical protein
MAETDILTQLRFVAVDNDMYVKLAGTWYNTGDMSKHHGRKPDGDSDNAEAKADESGVDCKKHEDRIDRGGGPQGRPLLFI